MGSWERLYGGASPDRPGNRSKAEYDAVQDREWYRDHPKEARRVFGPKSYSGDMSDTREADHAHALRMKAVREAHPEFPRSEDYGPAPGMEYVRAVTEFWNDHPDECRCLNE